jgi:hypothetical protein
MFLSKIFLRNKLKDINEISHSDSAVNVVLSYALPSNIAVFIDLDRRSPILTTQYLFHIE